MVLLLPAPVMGQDVQEEPAPPSLSYSKGDQNFILNAGLFLPLFYVSIADGTFSSALDTTRPGINGSLSWVSFLNDSSYLGFEFGGAFAGTLNRSFFMIPVLGKYGYSFSSYPFEIPLSVGAGVNFMKVNSVYDSRDLFTATTVLKPEAGFYWNWSSEWAFGMNITYWLVPEIYFSEDLQSQSMLGNFLDIRLSVMYHF